MRNNQRTAGQIVSARSRKRKRSVLRSNLQREFATSPGVDRSVDFKMLILHQVVNFSTRFVQHVSALYLSRHRITLPETRALFLLGRYGDLAPIRIAELATTDRATVTRAISALRRRKLVRVRSDPSHHKRTLASLTPAGAKLHDQLARLANFRNEWLKEQFAAGELRVLFALLQRLEGLAQSLPTQLPGDDGQGRGSTPQQKISPPPRTVVRRIGD